MKIVSTFYFSTNCVPSSWNSSLKFTQVLYIVTYFRTSPPRPHFYDLIASKADPTPNRYLFEPLKYIF